ncbi:MAG TPA: hypothetical protein VJQ44_10725 [Gemmatimonadales bacterium]|nr:hypothetical protein [Gemmatimonadales bacterium]
MTHRTSLPTVAILWAILGPAPAAAQHGHEHRRADSDTAFASMQARGKSAMGVDQYTSAHQFQDLADGGRIELQRDSTDSAGVAEIRAHLQSIATAFGSGNFDVPGFVHAGEVPGTAIMRQRRNDITYRFHPLPGGGEVRIGSTDTTAVRAVHEFLAFQRREHRVEHAHERIEP